VPKTYELRYQRAPGKWVYVPTQASKIRGYQIIGRVTKTYSPHSIFFHLGARGGHVAALRRHLDSRYFSRLDLANFFGNVTRTKTCEALEDIGFGNRQAFDWAVQSSVVEDARKILPQGFPQSPLLATLVLERSALGRALIRLSNTVVVTVYMDDVVLSGTEAAAVLHASDEVLEAAAVSNLPIAQNKVALAQGSVEAFNCDLTHRHMKISNPRLDRFASQWTAGNAAAQEAIGRYLSAINEGDIQRLAALVNVPTG